MGRELAITVDRLTKVAYVQITDGKIAHTREVSVLLDLDETRTVRGIEFLELDNDISFPPP